MVGEGLSAENKAKLDAFVADLGSGKVNLFTGLNYQDGKPFLKDGEKATDKQIWSLEQLLQGNGRPVQRQNNVTASDNRPELRHAP